MAGGLRHIFPSLAQRSWEFLVNRSTPRGISERAGLPYWRERIINMLYLGGFILGYLAMPPIIFLLGREGLWSVVVMDLAVLAWVTLVTIKGERLSYRTRAGGGMLILAIVSAGILWRMGPFSGGPVWLFTFSVLTAILFGVRGAWLAMGAISLLMAVLLILLAGGRLPWAGEFPGEFSRFLRLALNFLLVNGLVSFTLGILARGLATTLAAKNSALAQRDQEHARLVREMETRRRAQEELAESQRMFKLFAQNVSDVLWMLSLTDYTFSYLSPSLRELTGQSPDELMGLPLTKVLAPKSLRDCENVLRQELSREKIGADPHRKRTLEIAQYTKDGGLVWTEISVRFLRDETGRPSHIVGVSRDISKRLEARRRFQESEARFRAAFEAAPTGMAMVNIDRRFMDVNKRFCEMLGYTREELLGRSFNQFTHPDDRQGGRDRFARILEGKESFNWAEKRYRHENGNVVWMLVSNALLRDASGQPQYFICHIMDITAAKTAEEEKAKLAGQLQQAQKMEAVGALASGIAHDFNNVLLAIGVNAQLIVGDQLSGPRAQKQAREIENAVARAADMVKRLLTFSRQLPPRLLPARLNDCVESAVAMLARATPKMVTIKVRLTLGLPPILADPTQLEQIALNLGSNGADAMPEGGELIFSTSWLAHDAPDAPAHLATRPGRWVLLSVSDQGPGIPPDAAERIFEPFFTTKEEGRGTGLGLATVYGITTAHGGWVDFLSQPGGGATFRVFLPESQGAVTGCQPPERHEEPAAGRGQTILLVDDERAILAGVSEMVAQAGYQPLAAGNGEEALEILEQTPGVDLVLLDLSMPGMGGYKALERIVSRWPEIKVILNSGYAGDNQVQQALAKGAAGFLPKPFRREELLDALSRALNG